MNDDELLRQIRSVVPPEADATARERARMRAAMALRNAEPAEKETAPLWRGWWVWGGVAAAAAAVALAFVLTPQISPKKAVANDGALLTQIEHVFPGELNAVIERNGQVELSIADQPARQPDQPLLVEFRRGESVVRVLSYSGQHVCLDLGGQSACFEALINERGEVIVAGEDFIASPALGAKAHGWDVTAHALGHS